MIPLEAGVVPGLHCKQTVLLRLVCLLPPADIACYPMWISNLQHMRSRPFCCHAVVAWSTEDLLTPCQFCYLDRIG